MFLKRQCEPVTARVHITTFWRKPISLLTAHRSKQRSLPYVLPLPFSSSLDDG
jgi:hypothetical protein